MENLTVNINLLPQNPAEIRVSFSQNSIWWCLFEHDDRRNENCKNIKCINFFRTATKGQKLIYCHQFMKSLTSANVIESIIDAFATGIVALIIFRSSSVYITKVLQKGKKLQAELKQYEEVVKDKWKNKVRLWSFWTQDCIQNLSARRSWQIASKLSFEDANHKILQNPRERTQNSTSVVERILPRDLEQILDSEHFQAKSALCIGWNCTILLIFVVPAARRIPENGTP